MPPDGVSGAPETVEEVVALIHAFPKPVSLPCLLESLDRPLAVAATSNTISAQPAYGPNNPRIFIAIGNLTLAVVTKGDGRELLELGVARTETSTVKAEIHFPVYDDLALSAPFDRVRYENGGTTCGFCHIAEQQDDVIDYAEAFRSDVIGIRSRDRVDLDYLAWAWEDCESAREPDRCAMFDSIFAWGDVIDSDY